MMHRIKKCLQLLWPGYLTYLVSSFIYCWALSGRLPFPIISVIGSSLDHVFLDSIDSVISALADVDKSLMWTSTSVAPCIMSQSQLSALGFLTTPLIAWDTSFGPYIEVYTNSFVNIQQHACFLLLSCSLHVAVLMWFWHQTPFFPCSFLLQICWKITRLFRG